MNEQHYWIDTPALALVAEFHEAFGHPIANEVITKEAFSTDLMALRVELIRQKYEEFATAYITRDLVGFIDALQGLKYVIYGAELALGIASEEHFGEVHDAKMRNTQNGPDHDLILTMIDAEGRIYEPA